MFKTFLVQYFGIFASFCTILCFFPLIFCAKFAGSNLCQCYLVSFIHLCLQTTGKAKFSAKNCSLPDALFHFYLTTPAAFPQFIPHLDWRWSVTCRSYIYNVFNQTPCIRMLHDRKGRKPREHSISVRFQCREGIIID